MEKIRRQLDRLSRRSRQLLVLQRLLQWSAVLIATGFALAVIDYALRLPGPVRLIVGASVAATAIVWLFTRMRRAIAFRPSLADMALRVERIYPHLGGLFASAVELSTVTGDDRHERAMSAATIERAQSAASSVELGRLIDPTRTFRRLAVFIVAAAGLIAATILAPDASATAASRWFKPLGEAQWPQRTQVELAEIPEVWPADAAIPLQVRVLKGDREKLPVRAAYRFIEPDGDAGPWQETLMSRQTRRAAIETGPEGEQQGAYEAVIEPPAALVRHLESRGDAVAGFEVRVSAGDDTTGTLSTRLSARPSVERVRFRVTPPPYAAGLVEPRTLEITPDAAAVSTLSAREGARIDMRIEFSKPVDIDAMARPADHLPGLADLEGFTVEESATRQPEYLEASLTLYGDASTEVRAYDVLGLELAEERRYRFDMIEDAAPSAAITEPEVDQSVLPGATVALAAVGRDDLGLVSLKIEADAPEAQAESDSEQTQVRRTLTLAEETGRRATLEVSHLFELAPLALEPGDEVVVTALAKDVFALEGREHEPAASTPRRIRIIDEAELLDQIRGELASLRQDAVRMEQTQRRLLDTPADLAEGRQGDLSRRIQRGGERVEQLAQRMERNRMDAPGLRDLLEAVNQRLDRATAASEQARESLAGVPSTDPAEAADPEDAADPADASDPGNDGEIPGVPPEGQPSNGQPSGGQQAGDQQTGGQQQAGGQQGGGQQGGGQQAGGQQTGGQQAGGQQTGGQQAGGQQGGGQQAGGQQAEAQERLAREQQQQTREQLNEVIDMLDQGAEAMELRAAINRLREQQQNVAEETRRLLPKTIGREFDQLAPEMQEALKQLAQRQAELEEQARETTQEMRSTASALSRQSESDRDQAMAQALAEAAAVAERQGLSESMQSAQEGVSNNRLSSAGGSQNEALDALEEMLKEMDTQQQRMREMLKRRIVELVDRLRRVIEQQENHHERVGAVLAAEADAAAWGDLAADQGQLRRLTMALELEAARSPKTREAANALAAAVSAQAQVVLSLRDRDAAGADRAERSALASLREALELLEEVEEEMEEEDAQQDREELRKAYLELAERQEALAEPVVPLSQKDSLTRRERASLIELGGKQQGIGEEASALGKKVADTLVFHHIHQRIDAESGRAQRLLMRGRAEAAVLDGQRRTAALLRQMADALKQDPPPKDFESPQSGGGGGGGGGGGESPLVPPLAELKLLRSVQTILLNDTAAAATAERPEEGRLQSLSAEQRELADLGERLIDKMQQSQQPAGGVPEAPAPLDSP